MNRRTGFRFPLTSWVKSGALLAAATAMLAVLAASASAAPARYVFEMCDSALPGGGTIGVSYAQNPGQPFAGSDTCNQSGGGLSINQTGNLGQGTGQYAFWSLPIAPPPGGTMDSITITASKCSYDAGTVGFVFTSGWPLNCQPEQSRPTALNSASGLFWIWLGCDANYSCSAGPSVSAHYFATTEVDPVPPTLASLQGSLLSGNVIRGHQDLSVDAHDVGGGISNVSVSVNGLPAAQPKVSNCDIAQAQNPSITGTVAAAITPCPTDVSANWTLDTQAYPFHDGANAVQVCASDFATLSDPNTTCSSPQTVNVDNSCINSAVGGGDVLSAQFAGSNAEEITVGYGQGAEVTGQLADNAGDPISGATLCVKMQTAGVDRQPLPVGTVKTDAAGHYAYEVAAGPNRDVVIGYRHDTTQLARDVRYYAHARPTLWRAPRKLRNGQRVQIWGSVPGPVAGGRVIVIQANLPGSKRWLTFRKSTADPQGEFHTSYRFTQTTRAITYRFRAVVPDQAGYPWVGGNSLPVWVRVKG